MNGGNDNHYKDEWRDSRDIKYENQSLSFIRHVNNKEEIVTDYSNRLSG